MSSRPQTPRIPPLSLEERSPAVEELLDSVPGGNFNVLTTLVRAENLITRWLPFGRALTDGTLPGRDRELLILRTSWNCQAEYEWGHHVGFGLASGLSLDEINRVPDGPEGAANDWDALVLRAADELHTESCLSDATWAGLAERYDTHQLIEVPLLVGNYHMLGMALNSLGVPIDDGLARFPTR